MWFVAYLWVYSLLLAVLLAGGRRPLEALGRVLERPLSTPLVLIAPIVGLGLARQLYPVFDRSHALVDDWYLHSVYVPLFLFGFLTAQSDSIRRALIRYRWAALAIALGAWLAWRGYLAAWDGLPWGLTSWPLLEATPPAPLRVAMRFAYGAVQWGAMAAILGFGARHLAFDHPVLRYLTPAVFPLYILHQTITVVAGYYLPGLGLPLGVEALVLVAVTFGGAFLGYEIIRRVAPLRPLFGLRWRAPVRSRDAGRA
ncbi:MAG: acyltransferase family protein [Brevundimonas sp.]|uniref:acyltransferase family protein n=1 Tax=Brevundimonas sp. TaxID=1871086 RepID=UPI00391F6868